MLEVKKFRTLQLPNIALRNIVIRGRKINKAMKTGKRDAISSNRKDVNDIII